MEDLKEEYKNYCKDLNIDYKKESSKKRFIYDLLIHFYNIGELSFYKDNFERCEKDIKKILEDIKL